MRGILDLQSWDIQRDGPLSLSGQWDFGGPIPDAIADAPGVWNDYELKGKNLPGFGYATYRLKAVNAPKGRPLSLRVPTFSTAYEL